MLEVRRERGLVLPPLHHDDADGVGGERVVQLVVSFRRRGWL